MYKMNTCAECTVPKNNWITTTHLSSIITRIVFPITESTLDRLLRYVCQGFRQYPDLACVSFLCAMCVSSVSSVCVCVRFVFCVCGACVSVCMVCSCFVVSVCVSCLRVHFLVSFLCVSCLRGNFLVSCLCVVSMCLVCSMSVCVS